jgi:hypothetical protein
MSDSKDDVNIKSDMPLDQKSGEYAIHISLEDESLEDGENEKNTVKSEKSVSSDKNFSECATQILETPIDNFSKQRKANSPPKHRSFDKTEETSESDKQESADSKTKNE